MRIAPSVPAALGLGLLAISSFGTGIAQRSATSAAPAAQSSATAKIVSAAQAFANSLDDAGKAKLQFPFDGPQKTRWSNLPSGIFQRQGLRLGDLTAAQKSAVMNLLTVALSRDGYRKVTEIMGSYGITRWIGAG